MLSKTKTILVRLLWDIFYCRLKHLYCLCAFLAILALLGCDQDHKQYYLAGQQQPLQDNRVSPDTILLANLPDSLQPKPIFIENRPERKQAMSKRAKQFTSDAIFSKTVTLEVLSKDRYSRVIATV